MTGLWQALRPYQWSKNLLLFVPAVTAHRLGDRSAMGSLLLAFVAWSLAASALYLYNDLCDLESDRSHPSKRHRPLANRQVSRPTARAAILCLLLAAASLSACLRTAFAGLLATYGLLSAAYSWRLKRVAIVDVLLLSVLYTSRILAGQAATGIPSSAWLTAFSMFVFFGLGLMKRVSELHSLSEPPPGRGYSLDDASILEMLGVACNVVAVLVLALYIDSGEPSVRLYRHPSVLWLLCPTLFFWIGRAWLLAHRGEIREDPVLFALTDPGSLAVALTMMLLLLVASGTVF